METISHDGKVFTKATVLAKKYRYTTDYIGQLCRAGKVDSKLIGRAWFVTDESLQELKSNRYSSTRSPEIMINNSVYSVAKPTTFVPQSVRPVLSKTTHRSHQFEQHLKIHHERDVVTKVPTYHEDLEALKPVTIKKERIAIEPKEAVLANIDPVPIKIIPIILAEKAKRTLVFEPLPEVSLQGVLNIKSLDDPDFYIDTKPVSTGEINFTPKSIINSPEISKKLSVHVSNTKSVPIKKRQKQTIVREPSAELTLVPKKFIKVEKVLTKAPIAKVSFMAVPFCVVVAIFMCVGLLSLSSFVESDGIEFRESIKFNLASVSDAVENLPRSY